MERQEKNWPKMYGELSGHALYILQFKIPAIRRELNDVEKVLSETIREHNIFNQKLQEEKCLKDAENVTDSSRFTVPLNTQ